MISSLDFFARKNLYKESLLKFLAELPDLHLLTSIPGNIGDHLIWSGTEDFLTRGHIPYTMITMVDLQHLYFPKATLLIPGSGALTKSFHEWLPAAVIDASHRFNKVIVLPSSYDLSVPIVAECLSPPNVYPFAREVRSYQSLKTLGRAALSFDCAVYYHRFDDVPALDCKSDQDSLFLALREDKDSLLYSQGFEPNPDFNTDMSKVKTNLDEWIEVIMRCSTIITDRLHVAVASILLGKKLIYLDPRHHKISNYFDYTFRDAFDNRVERCTPAWLLKQNYVIKRGAV